MWIFSKDGYLSIVEYQPHYVLPKTRKEAYQHLNTEEKQLGRGYKPATAKLLGSHQLVRARIEADLDKLMKLAEERGTVALKHTDTSADYHYRAVVDRVVVTEYVSELVRTIDYNSHVKEVISSSAPQSEGNLSRYSGLFDIWDATSRWQKKAPYSGKTWGHASSDSFPPPKGYISWTKYFEEQDRKEGKFSTKRPEGKSLLDKVLDKKFPKDQGKLPLGAVDEDGAIDAEVVPAPNLDDMSITDDWLADHPTADPRDIQWFEKERKDWLGDEYIGGLYDDRDALNADNTRIHNEYLATLVVDALTEDYGAIPISEIPEEEIARAFRRVLSDEALEDDLH